MSTKFAQNRFFSSCIQFIRFVPLNTSPSFRSSTLNQNIDPSCFMPSCSGSCIKSSSTSDSSISTITSTSTTSSTSVLDSPDSQEPLPAGFISSIIGSECLSYRKVYNRGNF